MMARCFGITRNLNRCQRERSSGLFCAEHKRQPLGWLAFLLFTFGSAIATYYSALFSQTSGAGSEIAKQIEQGEPSDETPMKRFIQFESHLEEADGKVWLTSLRNLLRDHGYSPIVWKVKEKVVLEGAPISDLDLSKISMLAKNNGYLSSNMRLQSGAVSDRSESYNIVLEGPGGSLSTWPYDAEEAFQKSGYTISDEAWRTGYKATILDLPYPPWDGVDRLRSVLSDSNLAPFCGYKIYEFDPTESDHRFLSGFGVTGNQISLGGGIPPKWMGDCDEEDIRVEVIDPDGHMHVANE